MNLTRSRARIRIGKSLLVAVVAASAMSSCITSDTESGASGGSRPVADETRPASPEGAAGLPASPSTATGSSAPAPAPAPAPVPGRARGLRRKRKSYGCGQIHRKSPKNERGTSTRAREKR